MIDRSIDRSNPMDRTLNARTSLPVLADFPFFLSATMEGETPVAVIVVVVVVIVVVIRMEGRDLLSNVVGK